MIHKFAPKSAIDKAKGDCGGGFPYGCMEIMRVMGTLGIGEGRRASSRCGWSAMGKSTGQTGGMQSMMVSSSSGESKGYAQ